MGIPSKIKPFFISALPTVFTEELSYYDQVSKLVYKINELIDTMNSYAQDYQSYTDQQVAILKEWTQNQINEIYTYADQIKIDLEAMIGQTSNQLQSDYISRINALNSSLSNRITQEVFTLNNRISQEVLTLNATINLTAQQLKDYVDNQVIDIKVYNPVTGDLSSIQDALNSLAMLHKQNAITAGEYDALNLTASAYDSKNISAFDYDFKAKNILN